MKKLLVQILFTFSLIACNESRDKTDPTPLAVIAETQPSEKDSAPPVKTDTGIGTGLTLEEMADDTVFADGSIPTSWENAGITDVKAFKLFLKKLQLLVLHDGKEQLAKLVRYPLNKTVRNEEDFVKNYDRIFSKAARLSIANLNFSQIFRNSKGVMSEDGRVWFSQEGKDFKIIAVNN
jgi:hypothetical protein